MNLSETAFVKPRPPPRRAQQPAAEREAASESSDADSVASGKKRRDEPDHMDYDLRWFTPSGAEVDLCGHATLATAHALFELGPGAVPPRPVSDPHPIRRPGRLARRRRTTRALLPASPPTMTLIGGSDVRLVDSDGEEEPDPALDVSADVAAALDASLGGADDSRRRQKRRGGYVLRPSGSEDAGGGDSRPREDRGARRARTGGHRAGGVATKQGGEPVDFTCRFWGPNIGTAEDPVTGSAFCGLAPYWKKALGRKGGEEMIGYQASARGGVVRAACVKHKAAFGGEDETSAHSRTRGERHEGEILGDGFAADETER